MFGNPVDKPFVDDFDDDGVDTVGMYRESTGLVYFHNTHSQGNADSQFTLGMPTLAPRHVVPLTAPQL